MLIYVINEQMEKEKAFDITKSVIWNNRYYTPGEFEIYMQATQEAINNFKIGRMLIREENEENAMIIESVQIQTDSEDGDYITIKGRCLKSILYRRIIWNQTNLSGKLERCIDRLLQDNAISPIDDNRKIYGLVNGNEFATDIEINCQYTGDNLGETIEAMCKNYKLGWDILLNLEEKQMFFKIYKGTDRSYNQESEPWVVFSENYENVVTTDYLVDKSNFLNVVKVAGEGEGIDRKYKEVGSAAGLNRFEGFVDARDLSTNEGEITDTEYYTQLEERGKQNIAGNALKQEFEGEVVDFTNVYGQNYYMGDIVEVQNKYGIEVPARITEVIESEDESGCYTIPTFEFAEE